MTANIVVGLDVGSGSSCACVHDLDTGIFDYIQIKSDTSSVLLAKGICCDKEVSFFLPLHMKDHLFFADGVSIRDEKDPSNFVSPENEVARVLSSAVEAIRDRGVSSMVPIALAVPSSFSAVTRAYLRRFGESLGVEVFCVDESVAIALAADIRSGQTALVIDIGEGTVDCCVVETGEDGNVSVRKSFTKPLFGGFRLDYRILDDMVEGQFVSMIDAASLMGLCETARKQLSREQEATVGDYRLTREKFDAMMEPFLEELKELLPDDDADVVVVSGGVSLTPRVRSFFAEHFGETSLRFMEGEVVARGASLFHGRSVAHEKLSRDLEISLTGGRRKSLVPAGSRLPLSVEKRLRTLQETPEVFVQIWEGEHVLLESDFPVYSRDVTLRLNMDTLTGGSVTLVSGDTETSVEFHTLVKTDHDVETKILQDQRKYRVEIPEEEKDYVSLIEEATEEELRKKSIARAVV